VVAFYSLMPIAVRAGMRQDRRLATRPLTAGEIDARHPEGARTLKAVAEALAAEGFAPAATFAATNLPGAPTALFAIHAHRAHGTLAVAFFTAPAAGEEPAQAVHWVALGTALSDGRRLETANSREVPLLAKPAGYDPRQFPDAGVAQLHRIHQARVRAAGATPVFPAAGQEQAMLEADFEAQMDHQMSAGYMEIEPGTRRLRPTWTGACLMTWKWLPPGRWVLLAWRRHENARLLAALGVAA
jgi:hypothetical protein